MQTETFTVKNVKCGGCVANIQNGLAPLDGVGSVEVSIEEGKVTVGGDNLDHAALAAKLAELGYPEA